jgi:hypothetical protein
MKPDAWPNEKPPKPLKPPILFLFFAFFSLFLFLNPSSGATNDVDIGQSFDIHLAYL